MNDHDGHAWADLTEVPLPVPTTLKRRRNLFYQLIRLAAINLKMLRVIRESHHG